MEYAYSILFGIFGLALLSYAGLMALFKDYKMIPYLSRQSVKPKNPKEYMKRLSLVIALVSLSPILSAIVGIWSIIAAVIVLLLSMILFIWLGTIIMRGVND